jgi:hypothetical protein
LTQNQLPAHLQQYQTPDIGTTALANLGSTMPPHISIGGNRFTLIDAANNEIPVPTFDPKIGPYLDACIIDVADVMSRVYFAGNYDPSAEGTRPDCFSDNGVGPSIASSSPQAPTCAACPRSEWTKVNANGKKVPWCSHKYKIALLIPGFDTVFLLAVPPNSHGPLREYLNTCKGNGALAANLITRISFISQGTLQFHPLNWIDDTVATLRQAAYAEKKTDALVGRTDVARPAGAIGVAGQIAPNTGQGGPQAQTLPAPQVQQPVPFNPGTASSAPAAGTSWPTTTVAPSAATAPTAEPTTRRRRRTAAEMAASTPQGANGAAPAPQAPFPHPGQQQPQGTQAFVANAPSQQAPQGSFGVAEGQPATANPELAGMLDNFFKS